LLSWQTGAAQYRTVSGMVADSSLAPIPEVHIFITNGSVVGKTDANGHYSFELREGQYELVFSHRDYQNVHVKVVLTTENDSLNVILPGLVKNISEVTISARWKDPGPDMMRKAIAKRDYWNSKTPAHSSEVYIRAFEEFQKPKKHAKAWSENADSSKKAKKAKADDGPTANMAEIILQRDFQPPGKIKEVRNGVSVRGDKSSLFYTSTTEGDFNFYENLVKIRSLSEMPVMSPLSNTALAAYKFSFLGAYKDAKGRRILKIKVSPRLVSNSVFSGEIHLVDTLFYIYRLELHYPNAQLNEYNDFVVSQEYTLTKDSFLQIGAQRFDYYAKAGKGKYSGYTLVNYIKYEMPKTFPKDHFGLEISATSQEAYDRDSTYWNQQRTVPLNSGEIKFMNRSDSLKRVLNSKEYLDSMQKVTNHVTLYKLFLKGQEYHNRDKGIKLEFQPLMFIAQPWYPGGTRINLWNTFEKEFKNKKSINFIENISYGINNNDLRGTVIFNTLYDPFHRGSINLSVGRDFNFINSNAAFLDLAHRGNFYQNTHFNAYWRREIINGLFVRIRSEIAERKDISDFTFDNFASTVLEDNVPSEFDRHRAFTGAIILSYTPFQQYIREPKQKVILGSLWPTAFVHYSKGIPGVFNSIIDYDFLEFGLDHDFPLGLLGRSELRAVSGAYLTRRKLSLIDYRYQRRGDPWLFTPPMYAFQTLDSTFVTFKRFYEVHYRHHFNGSIVNRLPFLKPLGIRESAGINILYAPERRNMLFYEFYAGFDKLVKIWRERFKIGIYYTGGYSNIFEKPRFGFKINFEYYDRRNNSW
jgi:hypothetical protein